MFNTIGHGDRPVPVAHYGRVSTGEQMENQTVRMQVEAAKAILAAPKTYIVDPYLDESVSGTVPLHERPGAHL